MLGMFAGGFTGGGGGMSIDGSSRAETGPVGNHQQLGAITTGGKGIDPTHLIIGAGAILIIYLLRK